MNILRVVPFLLSPGGNQMNALRQPFLVEITIMQCVLNDLIEVFMNSSANVPFMQMKDIKQYFPVVLHVCNAEQGDYPF